MPIQLLEILCIPSNTLHSHAVGNADGRRLLVTQRRSGASQHMTKTSIILICVYIILIACVYIQQFNFIQ